MPERDSVEVKRLVVGGSSRKQHSFALQSPIFYLVHLYERLTRPIFCPLDQAVLQELLHHVSQDEAAIIKSQLAEVNSARPIHYRTKSETWFFKMRPFWVSLLRKQMFDFEDEVVILGTLKFFCLSEAYKVDVVCVNNKLSALEYNKSTETIENMEEIEILDIDLDVQPIDKFGRRVSK